MSDARTSEHQRLYCKDCRYCRMPQYINQPPTILCTHEESRDLVGLFRAAAVMRGDGLPCGPDARLFGRKPVEPPRPGFFQRLFGGTAI
jgi:hypothetical protein